MKFLSIAFLLMLVVCTAHFFLYITSINFFSISTPYIRRILMWLIFLLSISFIPSAILLRLYPTAVTGFAYICAGIWLGLFLYLFMGAVLGWIIVIGGNLLGISPNKPLVGMICFLAAVLVSAHGLWQGQHPEIKPIEVKIDGLPECWQNKKIVHLSDIHLGTVHRAGFMARVAEKVNNVRPELILITGDLFDGIGGGDLSAFIAPLNRLSASRGIFFVTGNHEGYLKLKAPLAALEQTKINLLDNRLVERDGLQILGISFPEHDRNNQEQVPHTVTNGYNPDKPCILMYHTPTNIAEFNTDRASQQTRTYWHPDTNMSTAKNMGIDLQLSGHTHRGQLFPFEYLTRYIYNGFDYGLHRDGNFQIYISSGVGTWGPPLRVACPPEIVVITLKKQ